MGKLKILYEDKEIDLKKVDIVLASLNQDITVREARRIINL